MHHADSGLQCIKGSREADLLAINQNVSAISAGFPNHIHAKEEFHQCTFTGTIFADKTQYLAGIQCKVNISQDLIAKKILLDIAHLQ